jgi:hypothetical protein
MSVSSAELAKKTEAATAEAAPTQVLITTAQVMFGTAAARTAGSEKTARRFGGMLRRFFGPSSNAAHPRPHDAPRRYTFIESALMEREMGRL